MSLIEAEQESKPAPYRGALPSFVVDLEPWMLDDRRPCRHQNRDPSLPNPWHLSLNEVIEIEGQRVRSDIFVNAAIAACAECPVQWDCASYAVRTSSYGITFAMSASDLRWLTHHSRRHLAESWVDEARADAEVVQVMVGRRRRESDGR